MRRFLSLAALLLASAPASAADFDVVVYGGNASGAAAAVQAVKMGKSVVLIEPGRHIGGLTSGGLGWTDSGDKRVIGGISREFYQRVKKHYDDPKAWVHEKQEGYKFYRKDEDAMWTFEPKVHIESSSRSEEHTSELQSLRHLVCRLLLENTNTRP